TGYEATLPRPRPASRAETVVVVGAGPAGCAAAAAAAACGHRVVVLERGREPGGQMRLALQAPGHAEIARGLIEILERWLTGCDVRYGVSADAEAALGEQPDLVIVATGARAYRPPLEGSGPEPLHAWDVLDGAGTGERVVVADWGGDWTGLDAAEVLAARGCRVRLVTSAVGFGEAVHQYQRNLYLERLDLAGVELVHHLRPVALAEDSVEFRNVFSERPVVLEGVDTLVISAGRCSDHGPFEELEAQKVAVRRVGDALGPRSLEEAIREGTEAGLAVLATSG
ncbi:MAG: FAD-dependent oxidoreductase, partial [Gaiellales bacterium]